AQQRKLEACGSPSAQAAQANEPQPRPWWVFALWVLGGLAIALAPFVPMLWRVRLRGVRLGGHARTDEGAAAHTLAAWQELTDSAWDFGILPDESQTPRKAAARIVRLGRLDPAAGAAVHRVADAVEQVLYAPRPRPKTGLA